MEKPDLETLTITGEQPDLSVEKRIEKFKSEEALNQVITYAFSGKAGFILPSASSPHREYRSANELIQILRSLPGSHIIVQQILSRPKTTLSEILTKNKEQLSTKGKESANYLDTAPFISFRICDVLSPLILFEQVQEAAYHVIGQEILSNDTPPEEDPIVHSAVRGMMGYIETKPEELLEFANYLEGRKTSLPYMLRIYIGLGNKKAVHSYLNLFVDAEGKDNFILNGVKKGINFNFIGRKIRQKFKDYDFSGEIKKMPENLRQELTRILTS